ncbi:oncoprotein-induced transcript 3 protein-like [Etheostoma cragini]|uniref:oncoprotein-induced transcript 3 protein-like n=1 Tax=Etheostoma cragini TaxID=417921 RepID=UPI00155F3155|nr:oncoprotein-induced transcript 3 protein-like [Etheostoma cragini]
MLKGPVLAAWLVYLLCHGHPVKSKVICGESEMTVWFEKYPGVKEEDLRLNDPTNTACKVGANRDFVFAVVPLSGCGTQIEENGENLTFKNEITNNKPDVVITRKCMLELKFECKYPKHGKVKQSYSGHRENVTVSEKDLGTFTYQFEFYPNKNYRTPKKSKLYPLKCDYKQRIYMQIEVTSSVNDTELFVESCGAAPYDNPNYLPTYPIIDNGCNVDPTVEIHSPAHQRQFRFSMEAFRFIGSDEQVYISCSVMMCKMGSPNTRCSQGCVKSRSQRDDRQHHPTKREAVAQSSRHFISQGPLIVVGSAESTGSPVINLNLNLVFIAGGLLAAVGLISAGVIYTAKISRVKYQPFES